MHTVGIQPITLDLDQLQPQHCSPEWSSNSVIFYFAPPPNQGESDTRLHRFLHALPALPQSLILISTTGVYGDTQGQRVNERSAINPQTPRAKRRASAEEISRVWCTENNVRRVVLRVPAIYGPNRLPLERLRSGEPVICQEESPIINRIHVDDLVTICLTAATNTHLQGVYNVSDGNALSMTEYMRMVARLANLPIPKEISFDEAQLALSADYLSYMNESKRVDNSRLLREFNLRLRYENLEQGLLSSLYESAILS